MNDNPLRFDDDVVIVTGAGGGLGRDYALQFAARGACVVAQGRPRPPGSADPDGVQAVVDAIKAAGGRAIADYSDITRPEGAQALVTNAIDAFGKLTVLVNNAGIISFAPFEDLSIDQWDEMRRVTLDAAFHLAKAAWHVMRAAGHGRIILTTSNSGYAGNAQLAHYGTMKMALIGLARCLAVEGEPLGISVNAVAPMAITGMNRDFFFPDSRLASKNWAADIAAGIVPIGPPAIVSPAVLWLAHRSTKVTGKVISSSSGMVAALKIGLSTGLFDPAHQPETLRDNEATILTGTSLAEVESPFQEIAEIGRHFAGWPGNEP